MKRKEQVPGGRGFTELRGDILVTVETAVRILNPSLHRKKQKQADLTLSPSRCRSVCLFWFNILYFQGSKLELRAVEILLLQSVADCLYTESRVNLAPGVSGRSGNPAASAAAPGRSGVSPEGAAEERKRGVAAEHAVPGRRAGAHPDEFV
jgi:hypothetical protein